MRSETRTTTDEALLGLLSMKPMTGYEIKQMIESSIGNFWSESFGQIYPTLKRLETGGWISAETMTKAEMAGGRASRRYRITPMGCARLQAWLPVPARAQVPRNELLLKLFFGEHAQATAMRAQIEAMRASYVVDLQRYDGIAAGMRKTHGHLAGFPYWMMTLRYGQSEAEAMVAWADESLAALDAMMETQNAVQSREAAVDEVPGRTVNVC